MKQIIHSDIDLVDFAVDVFKIDENKDINEQINNIIKQPDHTNNVFFLSNYDDAVSLAKQIILKNNNYNYAIISMFRYSFVDGEEQYEDALMIGELFSGEVDKSKLN